METGIYANILSTTVNPLVFFSKTMIDQYVVYQRRLQSTEAVAFMRHYTLKVTFLSSYSLRYFKLLKKIKLFSIFLTLLK